MLEFVAHRAQQLAARASEIPIELTAVEVGPSDRGREMISLDLSEFGDPLPGACCGCRSVSILNHGSSAG